MATINFERATTETLANVWILIARKKRTKDEVYTYVCKGETPEAALTRMAEDDNVFVTTFPAERMLEYVDPNRTFTGKNDKLFATNLNRLAAVGYATDVDSINEAFGNLINCLTDPDENGETMAVNDDWATAYKFTDKEGGIFDVGAVEEYEEDTAENETEEEA